MYVVVVGVKIDPDRMTEVRQFLNDVIAPRAQEFAGFRAGYWLRFLGRSLLFFEPEDAARARAMARPGDERGGRQLHGRGSLLVG